MKTVRRWLRTVGAVAALIGLAPLHASTLRIGSEDDWAPYSSVRGGQPHGMAVDIVKAIFAEAGVVVELVPLPYARCMEDAKHGRLAGCFNTLPDANLRKDYLFHARPLFVDELWILARANSQSANLNAQALSGKRVILTHGYTYGDALESNAAVQRIIAPYDINALRMLVAERGEFAVVYRRVTQHLERGAAKDLQGQFKPVGKLEDASLYLSFSRRYPNVEAIVQKFDDAHARLRRNGALQRVEKSWN